MQANPHWGVLGFLTNSVEAERTAESTTEPDGRARRLEKAKELSADLKGYEIAAALSVWLSKSKPGGVIAVEDMDDAYILNTMKMIREGRHPTLTPSSYAAARWFNVFDQELVERKERAKGEVPF